MESVLGILHEDVLLKILDYVPFHKLMCWHRVSTGWRSIVVRHHMLNYDTLRITTTRESSIHDMKPLRRLQLNISFPRNYADDYMLDYFGVIGCFCSFVKTLDVTWAALEYFVVAEDRLMPEREALLFSQVTKFAIHLPMCSNGQFCEKKVLGIKNDNIVHLFKAKLECLEIYVDFIWHGNPKACLMQYCNALDAFVLKWLPYLLAKTFALHMQLNPMVWWRCSSRIFSLLYSAASHGLTQLKLVNTSLTRSMLTVAGVIEYYAQLKVLSLRDWLIPHTMQLGTISCLRLSSCAMSSVDKFFELNKNVELSKLELCGECLFIDSNGLQLTKEDFAEEAKRHFPSLHVEIGFGSVVA